MALKQLQSLYNTMFDRPPAPPSTEEERYLAALNATFRDLPQIDASEVPPSEAEWMGRMARLRELVLRDDPRRFLRWDVVARTMFIRFAKYLPIELRFLKSRPDWTTRYREAIRESTVGHPVRSIFHTQSSGNLIHHAYHSAIFEERTGELMTDSALVFEFGGGYGSLCRLFFNLDFTGRYVIFDLPEFSALQRYYLQTLGLPVVSPAEFSEQPSEIACVSDVNELRSVLAGEGGNSRRLFIGTWSISESPVHVRERLLPLIAHFERYLIAYQHRFNEVDNVRYFDAWKKSVGKVDWQEWEIPHMPGNSYLLGVRQPG